MRTDVYNAYHNNYIKGINMELNNSHWHDAVKNCNFVDLIMVWSQAWIIYHKHNLRYGRPSQTCISDYIVQQHDFFSPWSRNIVPPRRPRDHSQRTCEGRFAVLKMAAAVRVRIGSVTKNYVQALLLQSHTLKIKHRLSFHKSSFLFGECCLCEFVTWRSEIWFL